MISLRMFRDKEKFYSETTRAVPTSQRNRFTQIVDDLNFIDSATDLHVIARPFCMLTHHYEKEAMRTSWVIPIFQALLMDYDKTEIADNLPSEF